MTAKQLIRRILFVGSAAFVAGILFKLMEYAQ